MKSLLQLAIRAMAVLTSLLLIGEWRAQAPSEDTLRTSLQFEFELASDFTSGDEQQRNNLLTMLQERQRASREEEVLIQGAFKGEPESRFHSLAPTEARETSAYIRALRNSYAKYRGALAVGNKEWASTQLRAAQEYADLAAKSLLAESQKDDQYAAGLQRTPFAVRRSPAGQGTFLESIKKGGLSPEHRKLMRESGSSEAEIAAFQQRLLRLPADKVGASPVEFLSQIAALRRDLAAELDNFARVNPGAIAGVSAQTFIIGNPHDRDETIDLFIRPISIPSDWKLSVSDGDEEAKFKVREVEYGKHYAVTLPAKAQVKVASAVVPVGEVGTNTISRWAVEGKIRDELIGGIVFEMNVPYIVADLKLPPVGSKEQEEELPAPSRLRLYVAFVAAGILIIGMLLFFLFWRKRRGTTAPQG